MLPFKIAIIAKEMENFTFKNMLQISVSVYFLFFYNHNSFHFP